MSATGSSIIFLQSLRCLEKLIGEESRVLQARRTCNVEGRLWGFSYKAGRLEREDQQMRFLDHTVIYTQNPSSNAFLLPVHKTACL